MAITGVAPRQGIVFIPDNMQFRSEAQQAWDAGKGRQLASLREMGCAYTPKQIAQALAAGKPPPGIVSLGTTDQNTEGAVFLFMRQSQHDSTTGKNSSKSELYAVQSQFLEANGGKQIYVLKDLGPGHAFHLPPGAVG